MQWFHRAKGWARTVLRKLIAGCLTMSLLLCGPLALGANRKGEKPDEVSTQGPRRHLATIVFAGLTGAILGLSTLSFYGRPQDRLSNIAVGFAIGVITGTVYSTYKAATEPREFYSSHEASPELWALSESSAHNRGPELPTAALQFEF